MLPGLWPDRAIYLLWNIWIVAWIAMALWTNRTVARPGVGRELPYRLVTLAGFVILLAATASTTPGRLRFSNAPGVLGWRFWIPSLPIGWAMVGLTAAGFLFSTWARLSIGRLWSGHITRKEDHHVVDTGPYALVRHPIYTGLITAALATSVATGTMLAMAGAALLTLGFWMKARAEERFLRDELGPEAYDAYARRVPMLVPFLHWP
jgi:protein-S-isoprenylcysteine O-methyltransferase Ste14